MTTCSRSFWRRSSGWSSAGVSATCSSTATATTGATPREIFAHVGRRDVVSRRARRASWSPAAVVSRDDAHTLADPVRPGLGRCADRAVLRAPRQLRERGALGPRDHGAVGSRLPRRRAGCRATHRSSTRRSSRGSSSSLVMMCWRPGATRCREACSSAVLLTLYGVFRISVEFLREPDAQIGFLPGGMTMGQAAQRAADRRRDRAGGVVALARSSREGSALVRRRCAGPVSRRCALRPSSRARRAPGSARSRRAAARAAACSSAQNSRGNSPTRSLSSGSSYGRRLGHLDHVQQVAGHASSTSRHSHATRQVAVQGNCVAQRLVDSCRRFDPCRAAH